MPAKSNRKNPFGIGKQMVTNMTKQEFALFVSALKTFYSKEEKLIPNKEAMALWYSQLQDIPYPLANAVLQKWVSTQKWSPSIAEIREQAVLIQNGPTPSWGEGWEAVRKAIRWYGIYNQQEAMESLSGITKEAVRYLGFRNLCLSENETSDRARFEQIYQVLEKRQHEDQQLSEGLRQSLKALMDSKALPELPEGE